MMNLQDVFKTATMIGGYKEGFSMSSPLAPDVVGTGKSSVEAFDKFYELVTKESNERDPVSVP